MKTYEIRKVLKRIGNRDPIGHISKSQIGLCDQALNQESGYRFDAHGRVIYPLSR